MSELPQPPGPHPSLDQLLRARRGPRDAHAERVLQHAALCARCAEEEWRLDAFEKPSQVSEKELDAAWRRFSGQAPRHVSMWRPLALAASVVLAFGTVLVVRHRPPADAVRGGDVALRLESPAGLLAEAPAAFRFTGTGDAPVRVLLFDAARTYEWTSAPATNGRVELPAAERAKLVPGVEYRWMLLDVGEAPAGSFRIR